MAPYARKSGYEYMSLDEFEELLLDKPENEKWELIGGRVIRGMVGARWEHNRIIQNISSTLLFQLRAKGSACRPFVETFWLKEKSMDLSVFPDIIVRCGRLMDGATHVSDPVVLFEVLSQGTQARDRHEKWALYQRLPSLKHYVLVQRDRAYIDIFSRGGAEWNAYQALESLDATLRLPAIDFEMPVAEIYRDVLDQPA